MKKPSCGNCGFCRANYCRNPKSPRIDAVVTIPRGYGERDLAPALQTLAGFAE